MNLIELCNVLSTDIEKKYIEKYNGNKVFYLKDGEYCNSYEFDSIFKTYFSMYFICSKEKYDYIKLKKIIELNDKIFFNIKLVNVIILSNYDELLIYLKKDIEKIKELRKEKRKLELKLLNNDLIYKILWKKQDEKKLNKIEKEFKIQHLDIVKIKNSNKEYIDLINDNESKYKSNTIPYKIKCLLGYREYPNTETDSHFFILFCDNKNFENIISRFDNNLFLKVFKNDFKNKDITINEENNFLNNKNYKFVLNNNKTTYKDDSCFYITDICIESKDKKEYFISLNNKENVVIINKEDIIKKIKSNLLLINIGELNINNNCGLAKIIE